MAPVHRKINTKRDKKKNSGPTARKRSRRGHSPGTLYTRVKINSENISFVEYCLLPHYKKARPWHFLKPEERASLASITKALVDQHIVTSTTRQVVNAALIELDFQGVIDLPPPSSKGRRKKPPESP